MDVRKRIGLRSLALLSIPLMAILVLAWGQVANPTVQASSTGPDMALSVSGPGVTCSGGECDVPLGGDFMLSVDIVTAPNLGYVGVQTYIDFGPDLVYEPRAEAADEFIWPDAGSTEIVLRSEISPGEVNHGALTGLIPPLPASSYEGTILEIDLVCSDAYSRTTVRILPVADSRSSGAGFVFIGDDGQLNIPTKTDSVVVNCGEAPPPAPSSAPTSLPSTGSFGQTDTNAFGMSTWALLGSLLAVGAAGLTAFGLRAFSRREVQ